MSGKGIDVLMSGLGPRVPLNSYFLGKKIFHDIFDDIART